MNSSRNWELEVDSLVYKRLKKMPRRDVGVILDVIRLLPENPYFGDIKKMKGENDTWRRRVGCYRLFYKIKITEKIILVFRVERRVSKTY